jgi:hypothetical protein
VAIVIQSRGRDELVWRDEAWRRNHFTAYMTAKAKARLTGRIYRLVDHDGVVLQQFSTGAPFPHNPEDRPTLKKPRSEH